MNMIEIIEKVKNKKELTKEEIRYAVMGYVKNEIPDYQMSAFLMAIVLNGMSEEEIFHLTEVMIQSGETLDLDEISGIRVDKHSTGGIGDKTTLVVLPLVASVGVKCAKMSGRGLGFTGGTIDKLESIPGFQVKLDYQTFVEEVNKIGFALTSQTGNLVPADKKIYALRDVTGTTESIPLIASSIMSKKIASGADKIVIDVKVGNGALMKTLEDAKELAHMMIAIGKRYQKEVVCVVSNMEEPLGYAIGNRLEVEEAANLLKTGTGAKDLKELVLTLASYMIHLGLQVDKKEAYDMAKEQLENQKGYEKFKEFIEYQGGMLQDTPHASHYVVTAPKSGYIHAIHGATLGMLTKELGGGRETITDEINYEVGMILKKKVGDYVEENEPLVEIYYQKKTISNDKVLEAFFIDEKEVTKEPLIYEVIM
ncbi:MAG: thymidine phosphorylase [Firmicutes bacterium]|nr:thymidine phosphorylase [Bacillota bacterium]